MTVQQSAVIATQMQRLAYTYAPKQASLFQSLHAMAWHTRSLQSPAVLFLSLMAFIILIGKKFSDAFAADARDRHLKVGLMPGSLMPNALLGFDMRQHDWHTFDG